MYFRRNNDLVPKNFHASVRRALAQVTRRRVMMFERRARAYRSAQKDDSLTNFDLVEKAVATRKKHRNAGDFDGGFIRAACASTADAPTFGRDDSCHRLYDGEPSGLTDAARAAASIFAGAVCGAACVATHAGATVLAAARSAGDAGHDTDANVREAEAADAADRALTAMGSNPTGAADMIVSDEVTIDEVTQYVAES